MARMARVVVPYTPHHVTQRGNRRQQTFFRQADYQCYLELLSEFTRQAGTEVWAYCLMPNHVHLVLVPNQEDGLRACLGEVHRRYTRSINFREGWRGHLWQERFHSFPMDEKYLLATVRYVENNPVVAKLCKRPEEWRWSSVQAHLAGKNDLLVMVKPMLDRVDDWRTYLTDTSAIFEQNKLIQRHTRTGRPLGNDYFVSKLERVTGKTLAFRKPGRKPAKGK